MRLLADIHEAFGDEDHLTTADLLHRLHDLDDAPWADWYGSPLSGRGLAKLLGPYRVLPIKRRVRGEQSRGYFRIDFLDAWRRYDLGGGTDGTDGTDAQEATDRPGHWDTPEATGGVSISAEVEEGSVWAPVPAPATVPSVPSVPSVPVVERSVPLDLNDWFTAPLPAAPVGSDTITCSDYPAHRFQHVRDGAGFRCPVCSGVTA
jgi:hypothetical protein